MTHHPTATSDHYKHRSEYANFLIPKPHKAKFKPMTRYIRSVTINFSLVFLLPFLVPHPFKSHHITSLCPNQLCTFTPCAFVHALQSGMELPDS